MILPSDMQAFLGQTEYPDKSPSLNCSVLDFLVSTRRNAWLEYENMKVYVRKSVRLDPESQQQIVPVFDVASVDVHKTHRGKGVFTSWLAEVELAVDDIMLPVFVENVMSKRFESFFDKRQYLRMPGYDICPSFWRPAKKQK